MTEKHNTYDRFKIIYSKTANLYFLLVYHKNYNRYTVVESSPLNPLLDSLDFSAPSVKVNDETAGIAMLRKIVGNSKEVSLYFSRKASRIGRVFDKFSKMYRRLNDPNFWITRNEVKAQLANKTKLCDIFGEESQTAMRRAEPRVLGEQVFKMPTIEEVKQKVSAIDAAMEKTVGEEKQKPTTARILDLDSFFNKYGARS